MEIDNVPLLSWPHEAHKNYFRFPELEDRGITVTCVYQF